MPTHSNHRPILNLLTIAGSDSGGGAGIQADLKTFSALGVYGASAITVVTAQNTKGVLAVRMLDASFVTAQLDSVFSDIVFDAVKIGALGNGEVVEAVARSLRIYKPGVLVLDPVMVSTNGDTLIQSEAIEAMRRDLLPLCTVVTPNLPEAAALLNLPPSSTATTEDQMMQQGESICRLGARAVLVKGGHLPPSAGCPDWLIQRDGKPIQLPGQRLPPSRNTHGTGCTLSSAIAVYLAEGKSLLESSIEAKEFVFEAMKAGERLNVGGGKNGPIHHFYRWW